MLEIFGLCLKSSRYISSTRIPNHIDDSEATLSLAKCCIYYLCQSHHDSFISDDEIKENLISGDYRLSNYAEITWLELIRHYIKSIGARSFPADFVSALEYLVSERLRTDFDRRTELSEHVSHLDLDRLKCQWPDLHAILSDMASFLEQCQNSEYHLDEGEKWIHSNPFTMCDVSMAIYKTVKELARQGNENDNNGQFHAIEQVYGPRPFQCGFLGCSYLRHGFNSRKKRDSHEKHHRKPWKCDVKTCQYAEIGFLSSRMRRDHQRFHHRDMDTKVVLLPNKIDEDNVQPLLFDFVRLDEVEAAKQLLPFARKLSGSVHRALVQVAASTASAKMMDLLTEGPESLSAQKRLTAAVTSSANEDPEFKILNISQFVESIRGKNLDTFYFFRDRIDRFWSRSNNHLDNTNGCIRVFAAFSCSDPTSQRMFKECEGLLIESISHWSKRENTILFENGAIKGLGRMVEHTNGDPDQENRLIQIFNAVRLKEAMTVLNFKAYLGHLLRSVVETGCSLSIAKALCRHGIDIDARLKQSHGTPLHLAAQRPSRGAADFMVFLLYQGANPEIRPKIKRRVCEEKGPKGVSKHIGMTWDELPEKVKQDRARGYCPPEYQ
ncbi:MAG: hypothetical protein Q9160_004317 [Pyrenula sp. 1 TL-2023]